MKLKGRKREVRSSPDDVAKLFSHTRLYLMRSPILHLVFEGSPLAWLLGHLAAMIAGYIRTRATAIKEILAQAIKARQVLSSCCIRIRLRLVLNSTFAVLSPQRKKQHAWGVTPRRGAAGVTGLLRYRRDSMSVR